MKTIGITGPTGAGKTTALYVLTDLGAHIVDADAVYHGLLANSSFCLYWEGVIPSALVKTRLKYIWSGKPVCSATCLMDIVESSMDFAFSILKFVR